MKAIVCTQYGSPNVLKLEEVEKPAPTDDEVLIKVYAAGANAADWHLLVRLAHGLRNEVAPWRESAPQPVNERMKWR
jgi:NADPH:quinone reductase-like Zn-dependent oxidoreductase